MNDSPAESLNDLMDQYVFALLDEGRAASTRRRIESDADWRAAYEAALARKRSLARAVGEGAVEAAADAVGAKEVIAAADVARQRRGRRRVVAGGVLGSLAAAAAVLVAVMWVRVARVQPPACTIHLLGQRTLMAGSPAGLRVLVTDVAGKTPQAGVPVRLVLTGRLESAELAEWTTDQRGVAGGQVAMPDWPNGRRELDAFVGGDRPGRLRTVVDLRRAHKVYLATDKPIYQPGQTVHVRCLVLRQPALRPAAGAEVAFTVRDPRDNLILSERARLSEFGIASVDLPTDPAILPGRYRVKLTAGGDEAVQTIEIRPYKLPAFAVRVAPDKSWYLPGEGVAGEVEARYHFGKAVAGAKVTLELADPTSPNGKPVATSTVTTGVRGTARFQMQLPPTLLGSGRTAGDAQLLLRARAIDTAGQNGTAYRTIVAARQAIRIAAVPENAMPVRGVANRLLVVTSYPDGRPAETTVSIAGLVDGLRTDAAGAASLTADSLPGRLEVTARDAAGQTGTANVLLPQAASDFLLRTDKPVYDAGETLTAEIIAGAPQEVYLDVVRDRQTFLTRTLTVGPAGRAMAAIDLPAELTGTLRLHAYRLGAEGDWEGRDVLVVVRPAAQLRVAVDSGEPVHRPGEEIAVSFAVTDPAGRPAPGALSLSAVDEAVYSVQDAAPGLEAALLGLDEALLAPAVQVDHFAPALMARSRPYAQALLAAAAARGQDDESLHPAERSVHSLDADNSFQARQEFEISKEQAEDLAIDVTVGLSLLAVVVFLGVLAWVLRRHIMRWKRVEQLRGVSWVTLIFTVLMLLVLMSWLFLPIVEGFLEDDHSSDESNMDYFRLDSPFSWRSWSRYHKSAAGKVTGPPPEPPARVEQAPAEPARVRTYFPETMLWRPEVVTDANGRAVLRVPLADNITTWRLGGQAVSRGGALGTVDSALHVFQPFFVDVDAPASLTAGDEVSIPLVVYNYTRNILDVELRPETRAGLTLVEGGRKALRMTAGQVRRVYVRVRADAPGPTAIVVRASAGAAADAVERPIRVVPPGVPRDLAVGGQIAAGPPRVVDLSVPPDALPGSIAARLRVYPSRFSELLDGLEGILRMPYGCFEQTSSATYPNVMVMQYLQSHNPGSPAVRAKARRFILQGYQRLLTFEVPGGGFDWYGNPPAKLVLTAYGLMQLADMAKVHAVDPSLLKRTADWLAAQQQADGSWTPTAGQYYAPFAGGMADALAVTAYVTWALASCDGQSLAAARGARYVSVRIGKATDAHALALCANALLSVGSAHDAGIAAAVRLADVMKRPLAIGSRRSGHPDADVSTLALSALAWMRAGGHPAAAQDALKIIAACRDAHGTWGTTQATVLALKALTSGASAPARRDAPAKVSVAAVDDAGGPDRPLGEVTIAPGQSDVVWTVPLEGLTQPGLYRLRLTGDNAEGMAWQVAVRYHSEAGPATQPGGLPFGIQVDYDRTNLQVGQSARVRAVVTNRTAETAHMLLADIPTPPGFAVDPTGLDKLLSAGAIERYSLTGAGVIVYVRSLSAGGSIAIEYAITARMPLRAAAPPAHVYAYYEPEREGFGGSHRFAVDGGGSR